MCKELAGICFSSSAWLCKVHGIPQEPQKGRLEWLSLVSKSLVLLVSLSLPPSHLTLELLHFFGAVFFYLLRLTLCIFSLQRLSLMPPHYSTVVFFPCAVWFCKFPWWHYLGLYANRCWLMLLWFVSICWVGLESLLLCGYNFGCSLNVFFMNNWGLRLD